MVISDEYEKDRSTEAQEEIRYSGIREAEHTPPPEGDPEAQVDEEPWFPSLEDAVVANQQALAESGQTNHALLRPEVLDGALGRAANYWHYAHDMAQAAAAVAHGVGQAQAFEDGNKRTAFHLTHAFLTANGLAQAVPDDDVELADHLIGYGEGTHSLEDTANLLRQRIGQRQSNILDPVHSELDPRVWDSPEHPEPHLKSVHRNWIHQTIVGTLADHGYDGMENWLSLVLTGSLTTYQYSDESDCDVSLFVDTKAFPDWSRAEMIAVMIANIDGTALPGTPHLMQCFVVSKTLTKEDLYKPGLRSGYDLTIDQWIVPPDKNRVHDVEREMNEAYTTALESADKMEMLLRYEPDKAKMYWHQIHKRRQRDQLAGKGDFAPSNIIYKMLNNRGLFPQIAESTGEYIAAVNRIPCRRCGYPVREDGSCPQGCINGFCPDCGARHTPINCPLNPDGPNFRGKTAAGMDQLPPQEWAYIRLLKEGGLDPRSPFMPWLVKQIKNGAFKHSEYQDERINELIQARANEDRWSTDVALRRLGVGDRWGNPDTHTLFRLPKVLKVGKNELYDVEDFLPYLRKYHRWASKQPGYNLNSLNPAGVINAYNATMKERAANYGKVVHSFPNGWTIRKLRNAEEANHEGAAMANCIGDYGEDIEGGGAHIYSLRDEKNRPKLSLEMSPRGPKTWQIDQMFEKANKSEIRPAFKTALKDWFARMQQRGYAIHGTDTVPVEHPNDLAKPALDEYGLPADHNFNWTPLYNSLLKPDGTTYEYRPENVDAVFNALNSPDRKPYRREEDMRSLWLRNQEQVKALQTVRQAVPPEQWQQLKTNPYTQTVGYIQRKVEPYKGNANGDYFDISLQPRRVPPNPAEHVYAAVQEHTNPYGEPCSCPWGNR